LIENVECGKTTRMVRGNAKHSPVNFRAKSQSLEAQLVAMCAQSSQVTQGFFEVKEELEEENEFLQEKVCELTDQLSENESRIENLERENGEIRSQESQLMTKIEGLGKILSQMQRQRDMLLRTTDRWEDTLQAGADLEAVRG